MGSPKVQAPSHIHSNGHLALPTAVQLVQEAELNGNAFISLARNFWGETAQEEAVWADRAALLCQSPWAPPPDSGQQVPGVKSSP